MADAPLSELEARLADVHHDPIQRVDRMTDLAWALRIQDTVRANRLAKEARALAIEHGYTLGQAWAARILAMAMVDEEGLRTVYPLAQEARKLFDQVGDLAGRAASRDFLASLHEHVGDLAGGMEHAMDALGLARDLGDPIRQGYALSSVGGILAASGEVEAGVARLQEALELFQEAGDEQGIGTICSRLSKVLKKANHRAQARFYADRCIEVADTTQDASLRWAGLMVIAELREEDGQAQEAERLYRSALDCLPREPVRSVVGTETQVALGRLLMKQERLTEAEFELKDALRRIEGNTVSMVVETTVHEGLAELYEAAGELSATVHHLRRAKTLRAEVSERDARNKLAQVEARAAMEAAQKDAEIHKLRFVELYGMQAKLVEAEKMALLGKLAAGTAHELHSPLGVLRTNTDLYATATDRLLALVREDGRAEAQSLAPVLESCRKTCEEAIQRIASIAQSFRRFTQLDQAERRIFDVREGLDAALALLEPTVPSSIRLQRSFEDVPRVDGWPREVNHAFMTVLQNATQAIDGAGVVRVESRAEAETVVVRVEDSGRGMTREQVDHLFDVAWSHGGGRTGMRLGLLAAFNTMQKHRGTIHVESALGQGTAVTFRFPAWKPVTSSRTHEKS
ncbi:MAG: ATP-binding protein [Myxococcota bacterium]